eukprot:UN28214
MNSYKWIPSLFKLKRTEEKVEVDSVSYINNIFPDQHAELYKLIPKVFNHMIPLFQRFKNNFTKRKSEVQVIVKAANMYLDKKDDKYNGGSW